ncbi:CARDB domain-containing protein [Baekduia sp. Peel2402]|uniref:CARDB domain-containing protein n=1 Tax=Baekduia sp. Peel2402 TaxID=3458296 RepID=UPI00403EAEEB
MGRAWATAGAVFAALAAGAVPGAAAKTMTKAQRADLTVTHGTLGAVISGGTTKVKGSVVVRNAGRRTAGATSISVTVGARLVGRVHVAALRAGVTRTVAVSLRLPAGVKLPVSVKACADSRHRVTERRETNNCKTLGRLVAPGATPPSTTTPTSGASTTVLPVTAPVGPVAPVAPAEPVSSVPTVPIAYSPNTTFALGGSWVSVPSSYDKTHQTPTELFVWLHGCDGISEGEIGDVMSPPTGPYIALAVGGRERDCWYVGTDDQAVLNAIAMVKSHFNIDPKRVVIGGYSSGGDESYRLAFQRNGSFAGVLALNTTPLRDTGADRAASLAASFKFPVVHLAHTSDTAYDIATVRSETDAMANAGFPITRVERSGAHYDANTFPDMKAVLLPHLWDGWRAP